MAPSDVDVGPSRSTIPREKVGTIGAEEAWSARAAEGDREKASCPLPRRNVLVNIV